MVIENISYLGQIEHTIYPSLLFGFFLGFWDLIGYIYHWDNCIKQKVNRDEYLRHYLKSSKVGVKGLLSWALEKARSTQMTTMCVPTSNCLVGKLQM